MKELSRALLNVAAKTLKKVIFSIKKDNIFIEKLNISIEKGNIFIKKLIISIKKDNIFIKKLNISIKKLNIFIEKPIFSIEKLNIFIKKAFFLQLGRTKARKIMDRSYRKDVKNQRLSSGALTVGSV